MAATPVQTFTIHNPRTFGNRHFEVHISGQPILWVKNPGGAFSRPQLDFHTGSEEGPIVASMKLRAMRSGSRILVGDPNIVPESEWIEVDAESFTNKQYRFRVAGRDLMWRRTHDETLGAHTLGSGDFKLIDTLDEKRVLAVHIANRNKFSDRHLVARIDFFEQLDKTTELAALAAMMGIEERLRRNKNSSAGAAGGGGGGGA